MYVNPVTMNYHLPDDKLPAIFRNWQLNAGNFPEYYATKENNSRQRIKVQLMNVVDIAKTFNRQLEQEDQVTAVQYYLRLQGDQCFDLLALVPKNTFFDQDIFSKITKQRQLIKEWSIKKGYYIAVIIAPWVKNIASLHLDKEGYVLIYNAA